MDPLKSEHPSIPFLKNLFSRCDPNGSIQIGTSQKIIIPYLSLLNIDFLPSLLENHKEEEVFFGPSVVGETLEIPAIGIKASIRESNKESVLEMIKTLLPKPTFVVISEDFLHSFWKLQQPVTREFNFENYRQRVRALFGKVGTLVGTGPLPGTGNAEIVQGISFPKGEYSLEDLEAGFLPKEPDPSPREESESVSPPAPAALAEETGKGQVEKEQGSEGEPGREDREAGPGQEDPPSVEKARPPRVRPKAGQNDEINFPDEGWVKLHRKLLANGWLRNPKLLTFWIYCLLKATHKPVKVIHSFKEIYLQPGQFIFGRIKAVKETGLSEQEIRTCINFFKTAQNLTIKSTNKYSIISIINWDIHQNPKIQNNQQINQQVTTFKNIRKKNSLVRTALRPLRTSKILKNRKDRQARESRSTRKIQPPTNWQSTSGSSSGRISQRRNPPIFRSGLSILTA